MAVHQFLTRSARRLYAKITKVLLLFILSTLTGPFLAAFLVTNALAGRPGLRKLFLRMVQWRVGIKWYLLVLLGYPVLLYAGLALVEGLEVLASPAESLPLLASVYLPGVLFGILMPGLGEETGWRLRRPPIPGRGWRSSAWRRWQSQC